MAIEMPFSRARDHPRWQTLVGSSDQADKHLTTSDEHHKSRQQRREHLKQRFGNATSPSHSGSYGHPTARSPSYDFKGKSKASFVFLVTLPIVSARQASQRLAAAKKTCQIQTLALGTMQVTDLPPHAHFSQNYRAPILRTQPRRLLLNLPLPTHSPFTLIA